MKSSFNSDLRFHHVVVNVLDCDLVVIEFELQMCNYVHFLTYTIGKGMNPHVTPRYVLLQGWPLNNP